MVMSTDRDHNLLRQIAFPNICFYIPPTRMVDSPALNSGFFFYSSAFLLHYYHYHIVLKKMPNIESRGWGRFYANQQFVVNALTTATAFLEF